MLGHVRTQGRRPEQGWPACLQTPPEPYTLICDPVLQREADPVTVFMGVPTMYAYLLSAYEAMDSAQQQGARAAVRRWAPRAVRQRCDGVDRVHGSREEALTVQSLSGMPVQSQAALRVTRVALRGVQQAPVGGAPLAST